MRLEAADVACHSGSKVSPALCEVVQLSGVENFAIKRGVWRSYSWSE